MEDLWGIYSKHNSSLTPSSGDIDLASCLNRLRVIWGDDSQQWKDISSWNNGRWAAIIEAMKKYE